MTKFIIAFTWVTTIFGIAYWLTSNKPAPTLATSPQPQPASSIPPMVNPSQPLELQKAIEEADASCVSVIQRYRCVEANMPANTILLDQSGQRIEAWKFLDDTAFCAKRAQDFLDRRIAPAAFVNTVHTWQRKYSDLKIYDPENGVYVTVVPHFQ
jgi:hypothetical protein